jgi:hypothetical protein
MQLTSAKEQPSIGHNDVCKLQYNDQYLIENQPVFHNNKEHLLQKLLMLHLLQKLQMILSMMILEKFL